MSILVYLLLILASIYIISVFYRSYTSKTEAFTSIPINPCETVNTTQPSYAAADCSMYENMFEPVYNSLTDTVLQADFIRKYQTYALTRSGQSYVDTYDKIVDKFIGFHNEIFKFIGGANIVLPDTYKFAVPAAIKATDYSPGVATWDEASAVGNAYKCVKYTTNENDILEKLQKLSGILDNGKQVTTAKENICKSKGYFIQTEKKECGTCDDGCCMSYVKSGSDDAAAAAATETETKVQCPKPKVRPFQIPPRQIRLRVVPPKVKQLAECFEDSGQFYRDVSQIVKSNKYEELQQFPLF